MRVPGIDRDPARGQRIRKARLRRKLSQQEMADAVGVSPKTIYSWETGAKLTRPNMRVAAEVLDVTVDHLLEGEIEQEPEPEPIPIERLNEVEAALADRLDEIESEIASLTAAIEALAPVAVLAGAVEGAGEQPAMPSAPRGEQPQTAAERLASRFRAIVSEHRD